MIARIAPTWQTENWQKSLAEAIRDPAELLQLLELPDSLLPAARRAAETFPLRVPRSYLARIRKGDPADPLLLQVLPLQAENEESTEEYSHDPVGDLASTPVPGLIHKYPGRVLLITTGACAVHCRYCFRRHFPYADSSSTPANLAQIMDYIGSDDSLHEVILSGGDPLSLSTSRLEELGKALASVPHLKRIRFHTRFPIVLPDRIDSSLLDWLHRLPLQKVMVVHANHAQEIDTEIRHGLHQLRDAGVILLNQSVLLKGVNDSLPALKALSEALFEAGVTPYYLHQLDKVSGAQHFEVSDSKALKIVKKLAQNLPGYMVPRLVRETPGEKSKLPVPAKLL